ncbi:MAG: ECF-type sigma factor, partial [Gemmatimonadaceae bacterium]
EAYLRLVDADKVAWEDQTHFLALVANTMRRVLIDHARSRRADKRGGDQVRVDLDAASFSADESADMLVAIDDALDRLGELSPRLVKVVECRFFGGLTEEETASALGVTDRTIRRDWLKAKGLLASMLGDASS